VQGMPIFKIALAFSFFSHAVFADVNSAALKAAQCALMAKAYNRCERHVIFHPDQNLVDLLSLNKSVVCDDGKDLPFLERLRNSDVASTLSQNYLRGRVALPVTELNFSPGGIRNQDFIKAIYGSTESEVRKNLVLVSFLGQQVLFNRLNGAARQLELVSQDLLKVFKSGSEPKLNAFLKPFLGLAPCAPAERCKLSSETFVWRVVKDTTALSNHSFGTAIDLQPASGTQYWLWDLKAQIKKGDAIFAKGADPTHFDPHDIVNFKPQGNPEYPEKLVEIFEKHGFIWGGKWYRYDIMHFEFRPEFFPDEDLACE
jgi:hypothetical protein